MDTTCTYGTTWYVIVTVIVTATVSFASSFLLITVDE